jgi:hypothetical protein
MFVVLCYFIFLVVEVLLGRNVFSLHLFFGTKLTLTASKLIKESTATVAALLSAWLASRRNSVLIEKNKDVRYLKNNDES